MGGNAAMAPRNTLLEREKERLAKTTDRATNQTALASEGVSTTTTTPTHTNTHTVLVAPDTHTNPTTTTSNIHTNLVVVNNTYTTNQSTTDVHTSTHEGLTSGTHTTKNTITTTTTATPTPVNHGLCYVSHTHATPRHLTDAVDNNILPLVPPQSDHFRNTHDSSISDIHSADLDNNTDSSALIPGSPSDIHTHLIVSPSSAHIVGAHIASLSPSYTPQQVEEGMHTVTAPTHTETLTYDTTHRDTPTHNSTHTPGTNTKYNTMSSTPTSHIADTPKLDSCTPIAAHASTPTLNSSTSTRALANPSPTPTTEPGVGASIAKYVTATSQEANKFDKDLPETKVLLVEEDEEEGKGVGMVTPCCRCRRHHANSPDVDGGWAWVVFVMGFLQFFLSSTMYYSFSVYFVELVHAFGETRAKTGWVYSTNSALHFFCGPLGGWTNSRWGPRSTVMIGGVLAGFGFVGSAFSPSLNIIFFTYGVINGMGTCLNFSGWVVGLGRFWERRKFWITGLAMGGSGLGVAILGPSVSLLVGHYGWRGAMLISAGLSFNFCVFGATLITRLRPPRKGLCQCRLLSKGEEGHDDGGEAEKEVSTALPLSSLAASGSVSSLDQAKKTAGHRKMSLREVAMWPGFWLLQTSCFLSFLATTTIYAVLLDWVEWAGLAAAFSGSLAGSGVGDVAGRVVAGLVSGRAPPLLLFSGMQLLMAVVMTCAALATTPIQLVIAMVGVGVANGLQIVLHALLPSQFTSGAGVGHVLGWLLVVAGLGALAGPPLAGLLVDITHSYVATIALCTTAPAVASLLTLTAHCLTTSGSTSSSE